jgi:hypothetical protein
MDGSQRAIAPASIEVYRRFGILKKNDLKKIAQFVSPPIYNHNKAKVGFIKSDFNLKQTK